jgi:hypothetical protein
VRNKDFAVFILTNRRPDRVVTLSTLRKSGYTGRVVFVLDDLDDTLEAYKKSYPKDEFYVFSKEEGMNITDTADNTRNPKAVVYARNMCHRIARDLKLESFLVLDDDYTSFLWTSDSEKNFNRKNIKSIDVVFDAFLDFLKGTPTQTICFAQGGDFIGGKESNHGRKITLTRKAMNSFFCLTERPFKFYGLINEDVNMYALDGSRGKLCFTSTDIQLCQRMTQQNDGGLTTIYLEMGTYVKSFYSVLYHPSSVTIREMGGTNKRIHHAVKSELTYPKILSERYRRPDYEKGGN